MRTGDAVEASHCERIAIQAASTFVGVEAQRELTESALDSTRLRRRCHPKHLVVRERREVAAVVLVDERDRREQRKQ